jgi:glucosamine--fructose-6-phosphate aminotransferase (isomerizing)
LTPERAAKVERVYLLACGTSHHAAMVGRYYLESIAKLPTVVELASEFRNREAVIGPGDLVVAISQSGETLDTLMAAKIAKQRGAQLMAIVNVMGSAIARAADAELYTRSSQRCSCCRSISASGAVRSPRPRPQTSSKAPPGFHT